MTSWRLIIHGSASPAWNMAVDEALLRDLPAEADPCGERGEFHSCVYAGPMFKAPLPVESGAVVDREGFVFADLLMANS